MPVRKPWRRLPPDEHLRRPRTAISALFGLAVLLDVAAGTGLAYVAGFSQIIATLSDFHWVWLVALVIALLISFIGYFFAYRGIFRVERGPVLPGPRMWAVVIAGFGGFLTHGGRVIDQYAIQAAGADSEDARVRITGLAGLEYGVLAICACFASIAVLILGRRQPAADFTVPWAVAPIPGFVIAFWVAERYHGRLRPRGGWLGLLRTFLESVHVIRELFVHPLRWGAAPFGMALFWAADAFAAWAGLAAFGFHMNGAALFIGFATGMVFTRRTAPLAGAGVLAVVLPVAIWYSGAPLAVAVVGVFAYRAASLWVPTPMALVVIPSLRKMGEEHTGSRSQLREPGKQGARS